MSKETLTAKSSTGNQATKNQQGTKEMHTEFKPPDSMVQWWLLFTGIIVAIIYGLQLNAMLDANKINRQSLESVQRAYLTMRALEPRPVVDEGKLAGWVVEAAFDNSGSTTAQDVRHSVGTNLLGFDEPDEQGFIGPNVTSPEYVGPKAPYSVTSPVPFPENLVPQISKPGWSPPADKRRIFFWGWAAYRDVFPNTRPHITEFCMRVNGVIERSPQNQGWIMLTTSCRAHNCTDEYCPDYSEVVQKAYPK